MAQIGRISGPLLYNNLERSGVDLSFRNNLSTTHLLFLDVNTNTIGVNYANGAIATAALYSPNIINSTTFNVDNQALIGNFDVLNSEIQVFSGNITLDSNYDIHISSLASDNLLVNNNYIEATTANTDINLNPSGAGIVEFQGNSIVHGNIFATGNITADGNLGFGNEPSDTITISAQIDNDLTPNQDATHSIGSANRRFSRIYSPLLNGQTISTGTILLPDFQVVLDTPIENIFFVAKNGNDANEGRHPQDPFLTIKAALDAADSSPSAPITIYIYPGEYEEELPLTIPTNASLAGVEIRNTIVKPAAGYENNDVFLLNGETTVQNITIKGLTGGYAFKFAPNAIITTRSPYVQNITVTNPNNGGGGAFVDGGVVNSASNEAAMLFHSVTFITPGTNALVATNGARVEWLNSFTYFANKGIYAYNGTTGHLSSDGSTMQYGAEIRSIGSACVYGNVGIEGDGDQVLIYAINHNLAYIGTGTSTANDPLDVIYSNRVVKNNNAKIYFVSQDHTGNFSVGDNFLVDFESGTSQFSNTAFELFSSLRIDDNNIYNLITTINPESAEIGYFKIEGNILETVQNTLTINSSSNNTIFEDNLLITKNLNSSNLDVAGNFSLLSSDKLVTINGKLSSNLITKNKSNLGDINKYFNIGYFNFLDNDGINIHTNYIETVDSNADLELRASGTGSVATKNNLFVQNNIDVDKETSFQDTTINSNLNLNGLTVNNFFLNRLIGEKIFASNPINVNDIFINTNYITTTTSNSDLELRASGTGNILTNSLDIKNDLTINKNLITDNILTYRTTSNVLDNNNIIFVGNTVQTSLSNSNLELKSNSAGQVNLNSVNFRNSTVKSSNNNLKISSLLVSLENNNQHLLLPRGTTSQQDFNAGSLRFNTTNSILEGYTNKYIGFGGLYSPNKNTFVRADFDPLKTIRFAVNQSVKLEFSNQPTTVNGILADEIRIDTNKITTVNSNADIELKTNTNYYVENLEISNRGITQVVTSQNITFENIDAAFKFTGTTRGIKLPAGDTASRPSGVLGQFRVNTQTSDAEIFDGVNWVTATPAITPVTEEQMQDLDFEAALLFG